MKSTKQQNKYMSPMQPVENVIPRPEQVLEASGLPENHAVQHPSERVQKAIRDFITNGSAARYPGEQTRNLLESLGRYTGIPEKSIQLFNGLTSIFETIAEAFLKPGDTVLIAGPVEDNFRIYAESCGAKAAYCYGFSPFSSDPDGLLENVNKTTRMIFLANPGHPTGTVWSDDEIRHLLEHAPDTILVIDESYFEYYGHASVGLIERYDNLIVTRTFSEALGLAGYPCAYALASARNIKEMNRHRGSRVPSDLVQVAAAAVLNDLEYVRRRVDQVQENMIFLSVRLRSLGISSRITPTDLLLVQTADPLKAVSFLRSIGVFAWNPGYLPQLENFIWMTIGDDEVSRRIVEAFERMPEQIYRLRPLLKARVTLHRPPEDQPEYDKANFYSGLEESR
ncbi:MAG: histidinol-phosphate transaminase [candidate division Zixibacteria bacterium]|nr:histidinol-phosphate transaminase [candidate division Zixibacteria bacterium]